MTEALAKKEQSSCGPRSVYALTKMLGGTVTYASIREEISLTEKGCSIEDLRISLVKHGVPCAVRRIQPTEIASTPVPFIVHLTNRFKLDQGHFVIVTNITEDGLSTFDSEVNLTRFRHWRSFSDWWTGYAIVPTPVANWTGSAVMLSLQGIALLLLMTAVVSVIRSTSLSSTTRTGIRSISVAIMILASRPLPGQDAATQETLRSISNDGANAAALLGGLCGVDIPPGQIGHVEHCDSLRKVQLRLQAYGIAASVRRLSYDELVSLKQPCIVPLKNGDGERAAFCVFIQAAADEVYVVDAGLLIVRRLLVDDFRRYWTGHTIIGDIKRVGYIDLLGTAILGLSIPLVVYAIGRCARRWHSRDILQNGVG